MSLQELRQNVLSHFLRGTRRKHPKKQFHKLGEHKLRTNFRNLRENYFWYNMCPAVSLKFIRYVIWPTHQLTKDNFKQN